MTLEFWKQNLLCALLKAKFLDVLYSFFIYNTFSINISGSYTKLKQI